MSKKVFLFLVEGFEEVEAITPIDILRRGKAELTIISLAGKKSVSGGQELTIEANTLWEEKPLEKPDMIILPGGPGTSNYLKHEDFLAYVKNFCESGKLTAAICAAPTVLARIGLLEGKKAICYPGCEADMKGAEIVNSAVVTDGNITTGRAAGAAAEFAFKLLELLEGPAVSEKVRKGMVYGS